MTNSNPKTELKRPNSGKTSQQQEAPQSGSNSSTAIEMLGAALQQANQGEMQDFAQLLSSHQQHQQDTAKQIAGYLRPALAGQSLAQAVLNELAGTVERPQRLTFESESLDVPQLPDYELFRQTYERNSVARLNAGD